MRKSIAFCLCCCLTTGLAQIPPEFNELLAKARAGDGSAAYALGKLYESPRSGHEPNFSGAAYWYTKSSNEGVLQATAALAGLYLAGAGVPEDDTKAFDLYKKAAEGDIPSAMAKLGEAMLVKNYQGNGEYYGRPWIEKAARMDEPDALNDLGLLSIGRVNGIQSALEYFGEAAARGNCEALINTGSLYFHGSYYDKFPQNGQEAKKWFEKAQTCSGLTSNQRKKAIELAQRAARGDLPPLAGKPNVTRQNNSDPNLTEGFAAAAILFGIATALGVGSGNSSGDDAKPCGITYQTTQIYVPNPVSGGTYQTQGRVRPPGALCSATY